MDRSLAVGEFVIVQRASSGSTVVGQICRIADDSQEGPSSFIQLNEFLKTPIPSNIRLPHRQLLANELLKTQLWTNHSVSSIVTKCCVNHISTLNHPNCKRTFGTAKEPTFVCEFTYTGNPSWLDNTTLTDPKREVVLDRISKWLPSMPEYNDPLLSLGPSIAPLARFIGDNSFGSSSSTQTQTNSLFSSAPLLTSSRPLALRTITNLPSATLQQYGASNQPRKRTLEDVTEDNEACSKRLRQCSHNNGNVVSTKHSPLDLQRLPYNFADLCAQAICHYPDRQASFEEIVEFVQTHRPEYIIGNEASWTTSLGHVLSIKAFFKISEETSLWSLACPTEAFNGLTFVTRYSLLSKDYSSLTLSDLSCDATSDISADSIGPVTPSSAFVPQIAPFFDNVAIATTWSNEDMSRKAFLLEDSAFPKMPTNRAPVPNAMPAPEPVMLPQLVKGSFTNDGEFDMSTLPLWEATPTAKQQLESWQKSALRPPFTFAALIAQAIIADPQHAPTLPEIYTFVTQKYSYYANMTDAKGWQNSCRHNLSLKPHFVKCERRRNRSRVTKGNCWTLSPKGYRSFDGAQFNTKSEESTMQTTAPPLTRNAGSNASARSKHTRKPSGLDMLFFASQAT